MIYFELNKKLYQLNTKTDEVKFFSSWNQQWWNSDISPLHLKEKGIMML